MLFPLIFLFTVVPLVELFLLIQVGGILGTWNTIGLVMLTGVVGAYLARSQGQSIMMKVQKDLGQGGIPADSLIHGLLVFIGGLLLITPGIITDVVGFCFVIPLTRWAFVKIVKAHFARAIQQGRYKVQNIKMGSGPVSGGFHVFTQSTQASWSESSSNEIRDVVDVSSEKLPGSD